MLLTQRTANCILPSGDERFAFKIRHFRFKNLSLRPGFGQSVEIRPEPCRKARMKGSAPAAARRSCGRWLAVRWRLEPFLARREV